MQMWQTSVNLFLLSCTTLERSEKKIQVNVPTSCARARTLSARISPGCGAAVVGNIPSHVGSLVSGGLSQFPSSVPLQVFP